MRLNVPCTFERRHGPTFELTCVCSSTEPHLTHTLLHACDRTYPIRLNAYTGLRSNSLAFVRTQKPTSHALTQHECDQTHICTIDRMHPELSCDLFRSLSPLFPSFSPPSIQPPPPLLASPLHPSHPSVIPLPPTLSYHHHIITAPPLCHRQPSHHSHFHFSPHFLTTPKTPKTFFCSDFCLLHAQTVNTECACMVCVVLFVFCGGLG
jgi:hypothetical protein